MNHPTDWPVPESSMPAHGLLLTPTLRRDLADLNAQYLDLGLDAGADGDPRFGWAQPVRSTLEAADADTLARLASVPFALFELVLRPVATPAPAVRVEDGRAAPCPGIQPGRCESFVHQAVFLARRLVEGGDLVSGIVLSLAPEARRWLLDCRPSQLAELAREPATLRPRWRAHVQFWQLLVGAAQRSSLAAHQWAHCIGLCLIGAEDAPAGHAGGHRSRR